MEGVISAKKSPSSKKNDKHLRDSTAGKSLLTLAGIISVEN